MNINTITAMAACVHAGVPPILWGTPGIGKSAIIEGLFRKWGWYTETVTGNVREPGDFAGLPIRTEEGGRTTVTFAPPLWAVRAEDAENSMVFFDELTTSTPAVQAAMLRVLLDGWAGEMKMGEHVRFVAAANPPEVAADGYDLAPPLANRLCHIEVRPDTQAWLTGMTSTWEAVLPDAGSIKVYRTDTEADAVKFAARVPMMRARIAGFVNAQRGLLNKLPENSMSQGHAYPTPRSWDMAAKCLAALHDDAEDARRLVVQGCVGEGAAREYLAWEAANDLPHPGDVLNDPSSYDWSDHRQDRTFAVLGSVASFVTHEPTETNWNNMWKVLAAAQAAGRGDIAGLFAVQAISGDSESELRKMVVPPEAQSLITVVNRVNSLANNG